MNKIREALEYYADEYNIEHNDYGDMAKEALTELFEYEKKCDIFKDQLNLDILRFESLGLSFESSGDIYNRDGSIRCIIDIRKTLEKTNVMNNKGNDLNERKQNE